LSLLTPLYMLGLAALVAPIVFHLIRRAPKGDVPFSSLMFLSATPPRLTRRSRLDNILLLLLRAGALALLAFAFARPFLRQAEHLDFGDVQERRIALLLDTSASMRRGDLWRQAQALARRVIDDCRPTDQLALYCFDGNWRPLLTFGESATLDLARRQTVARAHLERLTPTWGGTNLGGALVNTVAAIEDVADTSEKIAQMPRRVVLVSDLSQGSRLDALGDLEWPKDVELDIKTVSDSGSNAGLQLVADSAVAEAAEADLSRRVRVVNNSGSAREKFELAWLDDKGVTSGRPIDVYVPPGESRVVRVPRPAGNSPRQLLRLQGDSHGFDNNLYFADQLREEVTVEYIGADRGDDPDGLLYYLQRVFADSPRRQIRILSHSPSQAFDSDVKNPPRLVILAAETPKNVSRLRAYLVGGGTILCVATAPGRAETLAGLAGVSPWEIAESATGGDVMLGEIAFDHPLFAPLAGAQFNDFTKIRFKKHRRIDPDRLAGSRVIARFENNDAAFIEKTIDRGRLCIMASGWQPADSQLARSSKFVPLMTALLEDRNPKPEAASKLVGEPVPLPAPVDESVKSVIVHKPDGTTVTLAPQNAIFDATDQPGLYAVDTPAGATWFAVNLDPLESKTAPLPAETIEQYGIRLANHSQKTVDREQRRQMYNAELENRQKLWRWLILAAIGILILETWLAGRAIDRPRLIRAEA
jgi:hypothetical protein